MPRVKHRTYITDRRDLRLGSCKFGKTKRFTATTNAEIKMIEESPAFNARWVWRVDEVVDEPEPEAGVESVGVDDEDDED